MVKIRPEVLARAKARRLSIEEWQSFVEWTGSKQAPRWVFRGQSQHWPLKPSIARVGKYKPELEIHLLNEFKRHSVSYFDTSNINDDWNWLALAQHHGLPTRLLDWTYNPLAAASFASQDSSRGKSSGVVYAIETRHFGFVDELKEGREPFDIESDVFLRTPTGIPRIRTQKGLFSAHPNPEKSFASTKVSKFEIEAKHKLTFRRLLYNFGIDDGFLMADLDGLSKTLKWRHANNFLV